MQLPQAQSAARDDANFQRFVDIPTDASRTCFKENSCGHGEELPLSLGFLYGPIADAALARLCSSIGTSPQVVVEDGSSLKIEMPESAQLEATREIELGASGRKIAMTGQPLSASDSAVKLQALISGRPTQSAARPDSAVTRLRRLLNRNTTPSRRTPPRPPKTRSNETAQARSNDGGPSQADFHATTAEGEHTGRRPRVAKDPPVTSDRVEHVRSSKIGSCQAAARRSRFASISRQDTQSKDAGSGEIAPPRLSLAAKVARSSVAAGDSTSELRHETPTWHPPRPTLSMEATATTEKRLSMLLKESLQLGENLLANENSWDQRGTTALGQTVRMGKTPKEKCRPRAIRGGPHSVDARKPKIKPPPWPQLQARSNSSNFFARKYLRPDAGKDQCGKSSSDAEEEIVKEQDDHIDLTAIDSIKTEIKVKYAECMNKGSCSPDKGQMVADASSFVDHWELHQTANSLKMSVDDVLLLKSVFDSFDDDKSGTLNIEEFEKAVTKLLKTQLHEESISSDRVKSISGWCWWEVKGTSCGIEFMEFLKWYSSNGFNEELLLSEDERWIRKMAKQYDLTPDYVESIKRCFDLFDKNNSGDIEKDEFHCILNKLLKVPAHLELPSTRIHYFWSQVDSDGSGKANFEEFLQWYSRYFSAGEYIDTERKQAPFEDFYKQVRRLGHKYLDPPAYPPKYGSQDGTPLLKGTHFSTVEDDVSTYSSPATCYSSRASVNHCLTRFKNDGTTTV